jgi:hypothetical protein
MCHYLCSLCSFCKLSMVLAHEDTKPSPEIKQLIEKMTPMTSNTTAQEKYELILLRKRYEHNCFLECVLLRLDTHRGTQVASKVHEEADNTFIHMLTHAL